MVNDLVLKERCAQLLLCSLVLLDEFEECAFLTRILTCGLHDGLCHFLIGHGDFGFLTDFGQQQAQTDPALGQFLVLITRLDGVVIVAFDLGMSSCHS